MGRPKGSKNKQEVVIKNIGTNTMPLDLEVNHIASFKNLPKGEMVEFGTQHALSKMEAITEFHKMTGTYPTEMYCQLRWFIPIDRKLIKKLEKERKEKEKKK